LPTKAIIDTWSGENSASSMLAARAPQYASF